MLPNSPTMIISGEPLAVDAGHPETDPPTPAPARLRQVTDALAEGAAQGCSTAFSVARPADPKALSARRAALAAALQEWSGATSAALRATALAVLAGSRAGIVLQDVTRATSDAHEETVFEAFFRGAAGHPASSAVPGRDGWQ